MKRIVWINKSNGQLCATIPKNSGIKEGDIISIEKDKVKKLVYTPVVADLFNYGHLRLLENANQLGDFHVCGVLSDNAIKSYRKSPVEGFNERMAIISSLRCVDMVVPQQSLDPTKNLEKLHQQFKGARIILVYGSNWKKVPGEKFVRKIGGKVEQPQFYEKLSDENIVKKMLKTYAKKQKK